MANQAFLEGMMPSSVWLDFANDDAAYAQWLESVDRICDYFIDIRFYDLVHMGEFDPYEAYHTMHVKPEEFFKDAVLPYVQDEHGADFIYEHIAENVVWGRGREPDDY